ncbi:hypothetical protein GGI20_001070 [Coemansia sp. BCRC 34301]|nr:hypothetical protein GGI20_001070 [Coemansia sp. BCRC 34301]
MARCCSGARFLATDSKTYRYDGRLYLGAAATSQLACAQGWAQSQASAGYGHPITDDYTTIPMNQMGSRGRDNEYSRHNSGNNSRNNPRYDSASADDEFFGLVDRITCQMSEVGQHISEIRGLHERALVATNDSRHKEAAIERDEKVAVTNNAIADIKDNLKEMANVCKRSKNDPSVANGQMTAREGRHRALAKKFAEQLQQYRQMEYQYSQRNRERLKRQYHIALPDATEEEVRDAIAEGKVGQIFSKVVENSNRSGEARRVLHSVEERHADIKKIEKTINELAQMFVEVSEMVNQQQEVIDSIDTAVEGAYTDVRAANTEVKGAIVYRQKSRKKLWCIVIFLIIVVIIVGLVLYFKLK